MTTDFLSWGHAEVAALLTKGDSWHETRARGLGGSDANILMGGDEAAILHLWRVKRGEEEPEDLSGVLPVIMGTITEPLNRYWYTTQTGRAITDAGAQRCHAEYPFMRCEADGFTATESGAPAVFEAKTVNAFSKVEEVEQRYMPQLHHNMAVCGVERAILSVFLGTLNWAHTEVALDDWYLAELIDREKAFWNAVQTGETPPGMAPVAAPVKPSEWRTVSMEGHNEWASFAVDWLANQKAAKAFEAAAKGIKALVEADVGEATGHGIACKRAKNGSLRIAAAK